MQVYFMRHGDTDWNSVKRLQGRTDIPLNEKGIALARRTAEAVHRSGIHFDYVYTSPLQRARKTAELMNAYSRAPLIPDERLTEFCFGEAEGLLFEEVNTNPRFAPIADWFFAPERYKGGLGAESFEDFFARLDSFLDNLRDLAAKESDSKVLIVCHGGVVRGLLKEMCRLETARFADLKIPNCGLNLAELKDGEFNLVYTAKVF